MTFKSDMQTFVLLESLMIFLVLVLLISLLKDTESPSLDSIFIRPLVDSPHKAKLEIMKLLWPVGIFEALRGLR